MESLISRLKWLRNTIAEEEGVEPYIVFHNSSLYEMAYKKPTTRWEFSNISGVGPKREKYWYRFTAMIRKYAY